MGKPDKNKYLLSFEIECRMLLDRTEFCAVSFRPISIFPGNLVFGLDPASLYSYGEFRAKNAGRVVGRHDKLIVYEGNSRTNQMKVAGILDSQRIGLGY
jgi:hypothetical protein